MLFPWEVERLSPIDPDYLELKMKWKNEVVILVN